MRGASPQARFTPFRMATVMGIVMLLALPGFC